MPGAERRRPCAVEGPFRAVSPAAWYVRDAAFDLVHTLRGRGTATARAAGTRLVGSTGEEPGGDSHVRKHLHEYYRPTDAVFERLQTQAEISFDANVLLNLYRYSPSTRDDFLALF